MATWATTQPSPMRKVVGLRVISCFTSGWALMIWRVRMRCGSGAVATVKVVGANAIRSRKWA